MGIAIRPVPVLFLLGMMFAKLTREFLAVEILLNEAQITAWLARSAPAIRRLSRDQREWHTAPSKDTH